MDMGAAFNKSAQENALNAIRCIDPYHCVQLVTEALDVERRKAWNELRQLPDQQAAKTFKGARWVLLKRPENLSTDQQATLRKLRRRGGAVWRAYSLKEVFRAIFTGDLDTTQTATTLDRWCSVASRSRLPAFIRVAKTIRKFRQGILAAIELGINNARAEGLKNAVFHSAPSQGQPCEIGSVRRTETCHCLNLLICAGRMRAVVELPCGGQALKVEPAAFGVRGLACPVMSTTDPHVSGGVIARRQQRPPGRQVIG